MKTTVVDYKQQDLNISLYEVWRICQDYQNQDRNVSRTTEIVLIFMYACLVIAGLCANLVVSFVVARRPQMHTARNLFIVNLTLSDMTLCLVCMPFTLLSIIQRHWDLGLILCKLVPSLQGANMLVSAGTVVAIALDRCRTIVRGRADTSRRRAVAAVAVVWMVSTFAVTPTFYFKLLVPVAFQQSVLYDVCTDQWPSPGAKLSYMVCVLFGQAVIPLLVIGAVHACVVRFLINAQSDKRRLAKEIARNRRTTLLLSTVAVLLTLSWLPLSLFSLKADLPFPTTVSNQSLHVTFAVCHLVAMSTAVSNPIVFGWLDSNIRRELVQLVWSRRGTSGEETPDLSGSGLVDPAPAAAPVTKTASSATGTTQTVTEAVARTVLSYTLATAYHNGTRPGDVPLTIVTFV